MNLSDILTQAGGIESMANQLGVSPAVAADMFAHQKSAALRANLEPSGPPSWAKVPSST